jgi:hypothetical protein
VLFRHRERCPLQRQALCFFDLLFNSSNFLHRTKTRVVTSGVNVFQMLQSKAKGPGRICDGVAPYEKRCRYGVTRASEKNAVTAAAKVVAIFRREVASIDKRIDLPWVHVMERSAGTHGRAGNELA